MSPWHSLLGKSKKLTKCFVFVFQQIGLKRFVANFMNVIMCSTYYGSLPNATQICHLVSYSFNLCHTGAMYHRQARHN